MGDRGNVKVIQGEGEHNAVWFYGHWSGYRLPEIVQRALAKKWRWDDPNYLARIIFDEMTAKSHGEETGFGIGTCMSDNEHLIVVVDSPAQRVSFCRVPNGFDAPHSLEPVNEGWKFDDYIKADLKELSREFHRDWKTGKKYEDED